MQRKTLQPQPTSERRSGTDRRRIELERHGRPERRVRVEARKPEVTELILSDSEWQTLDPAPAKRKTR
ncbi:MAG: hypothetical protein M9915_15575 [Rhizobacter sp.]|jgi:hypothetical protein|nr:hypothetical protein [Burkholderiaceae bacterium]MCO5125148.1 hypothetical protein [Rhizobacter sp.]